MDTNTILIENWGFTPEEVSAKQFQIKKLGDISNDYIEEKAKFYEDEYGISRDEFIKIFRVFPSTVSLTPKYVQNKFEFYKNKFGFTKQNFKQIMRHGANAISYSEEKILEKFHYFQKYYGISATEFGKIVLATPSLIGLSSQMFKERELLYLDHFNFSRDEFKKILLHKAFVFRPSNESILQREEFFLKTLGMKKKDFTKVIKQNPSLLCYSENSILQNINFIASEFDLSKEQTCHVIKTWSTILSLSPESLHAKKQILEEIGVDPNVITHDPKIVSAPEKSLKARYLLARCIAPEDDVFSKKAWYMTNQNKVYARLQFLKSLNHKVTLNDVYQEEKQFQKYYGISSETLMDTYRLDEETLLGLLDKFKIHDTKKLNFSKEELDYILENQEPERE